MFRDTIFSPVAPSNNSVAARLSFSAHNNSAHAYPKMEGNDLEAQEALARDFQPALEVGYVQERCDQC